MIIKPAIVLSTITLVPADIKPLIDNIIIKVPYESLYNIDTIPNKNTMEYNTMTMEELIKINNENLSANPE